MSDELSMSMVVSSNVASVALTIAQTVAFDKAVDEHIDSVLNLTTTPTVIPAGSVSTSGYPLLIVQVTSASATGVAVIVEHDETTPVALTRLYPGELAAFRLPNTLTAAQPQVKTSTGTATVRVWLVDVDTPA